MARGMDTMLILLSKMAPREFLLELLKERISKYEEAVMLKNSKEVTDTLWAELAMPCLLISTSCVDKDPFEIVNDFDSIEKARKLLNPDKG